MSWNLKCFVMITFLWFTRWFLFLQKNMKVENLFEDIKDGVYLLSLLEALSGEKLVSSALIPTIPSPFSFDESFNPSKIRPPPSPQNKKKHQKKTKKENNKTATMRSETISHSCRNNHWISHSKGPVFCMKKQLVIINILSFQSVKSSEIICLVKNW